MSKTASYILMCWILVGTLACENSFEPLDDSKGYNFSMYGTLNVQADTQWVRVMPISNVLLPNDTTSNGTIVTLTRESTGDVIIMNDSLFNYSGVAKAWNYWTTERVYPNEVYKVEATAPDGKSSYAIVETPPELPFPIVIYTTTDKTGSAIGQSDSELVEVSVKYTVRVFLTVETVRVSLLGNIEYDNEGNYTILIPIADYNVQNALDIPVGDFRIIDKELIIATGAEDWPDLSNFNQEEVYFPESVRNVENGVGLVAGVALLRMPLESCFDSSSNRIPCERLNY